MMIRSTPLECPDRAGRRRCARIAVLALAFAGLSGVCVRGEGRPAATRPADAYDRARVGPLEDGRIIVPTNQVLSPIGRQVDFAGRPVDVALSPDNRWLAVLNRSEVLLVDVEAAAITGRQEFPGGGGGSYTGILFSPDGRRVYASNIRGTIGVFDVNADGELKPAAPIRPNLSDWPALEKLHDRSGANSALPAGLAISGDGKTIWAALNLGNALGEIDVASARLRRVFPVGNAPYDVVVVAEKEKAYVSNWAGRRPSGDGPTGPSGVAAPVRVDPRRNIAGEGSVSVVDLAAGRVVKEIMVGLHASGLAATADGRYVAVANANSDTVSVIDTRSDAVVETIGVRPAAELLFGSAPNALAFTPDGRRLYASNGTNNAVAVIEFRPPHSRVLGCFPTGWYPAGLALDARRNRIYVANIKGIGSRDAGWKGSRTLLGKKVYGYNSHDYRGTVSLIPIPSDDELREDTRIVLANNRLTEAISSLSPPRADAKPRPVPQRHGEPSVFKHAIYIIKENRTYDQVFGDMEQGEGDESLCIFGREVTPNQHKLAEEFVLLDNFYCSGTLSADGHQWTDEAYVTDYLEKAFSGFPRSYPYEGSDAMAYASSGFLWDNVLAAGKTLRVYGEFVRATIRWKDPGKKGHPGFLDCYRDFVSGAGAVEIRAEANLKTLALYLCETYTGFPNIVSDVYRAAEFIKELKAFERRGTFPNFCIMLLPNNHTSGTRPGMPTPQSSVADNDVALGQIVEAVSHSRFWPETCIFVVEDDPQNGYDHVDGHRTVAQVISPYTKRRSVDSTNYNQTSMVRTIELLLGLPPMNQFDASATPMTTCFTDKPDLTPYTAVKSNIPLDQMNPSLGEIKDPRQLHWAKVSQELPFDDVDQADEDTLNRILWFAARGRDDTYPAWAVLPKPDDDDDDD
jgi:YVTN family beta-propeller protein